MLRLPPSLYPDLFKGSVLKGRSVCKTIRDALWSAGTEACPLYFRPISEELETFETGFLSKFSHVQMLIPFKPGSIEARKSISRFQSQQLKFIQELTVSDVRRARKEGLASVFSLIDKLMSQSSPLPCDRVLEKLLYCLYFKIELDEDFEDFDAMKGKGVEWFACRCIQHCISRKRMLRILGLGLKVLHFYLEHDVKMREAARATGIYESMAKMMEPTYWPPAAESHVKCIKVFKHLVSCSFFAYVDEKDSRLINSAAASLVELSHSGSEEMKSAFATRICEIIQSNRKRGWMSVIVINEAFLSAGAISRITSMALNGTDEERLRAVSTLFSFALDYDLRLTLFPDEERDFIPAVANAYLEAGAIDALAGAIGINEETDAKICVVLAILASSRSRAVLAALLQSKASLGLLGRFARDEDIGWWRVPSTVLARLAAEKIRIMVRSLHPLYSTTQYSHHGRITPLLHLLKYQDSHQRALQSASSHHKLRLQR